MEMKFTLAPPLLSILQNVGASDDIYTWTQIAEYMKTYILSKAVIKPTPMNQTISLEEDPLGELLGVRTFNLKDVPNLIKKHVLPANQLGVRIGLKEANKPKFPITKQSQAQGLKRKFSGTDDDDEDKKSCVSISPNSPSYVSGDESIASIHTCIIDTTKNSGEGSSTSSEDDYSDDHYLEEYEIESLPSVDTLTTGTEDCDKYEIELILQQSESDEVCWGDRSNDESDFLTSCQNLTKNCRWECPKCKFNNVESNKLCEQCFEEPIAASPEIRRRKKRSVGKTKKVLNSSQEIPPVDDKSSVEHNSSDALVINEEKATSAVSSLLEDEEDDMCIKCRNSSATAAFVHGRSAHCVYCYPCAKKYKMLKAACPECDRTISSVVLIL